MNWKQQMGRMNTANALKSGNSVLRAASALYAVMMLQSLVSRIFAVHVTVTLNIPAIGDFFKKNIIRISLYHFSYYTINGNQTYNPKMPLGICMR